jgi:hypothetical protein
MFRGRGDWPFAQRSMGRKFVTHTGVAPHHGLPAELGHGGFIDSA